MLNLNANWLKAVQKVNPQLVYVVKITTDDGTFTATDGPVGFACNYSIGSVAEVSPFAAELDVIKRAATLNELTVTFTNDGWARDLVIDQVLKGKKLEVLIGERDITSESDLEEHFVGTIVAVTPSPDGTIEIEACNGMAILRDTKIYGDWPAMHPLEVEEDIFEKSETPAELFDAPSLDPEEYPEISHFVISRSAFHSPYAKDLSINGKWALTQMQKVGTILDALVVDGEDGQLRFVLFDETLPVDDTWTEQDILEIEQEPLGENVFNDITIRFGGQRMAGGYRLSHNERDDASIAAHAFPGSADQVFSEELKDIWINSDTPLPTTVPLDDGSSTHGVGDTFAVGGAGFHTMCGARWPGFTGLTGGPAQPDWAKLSDDRLAYLLLTQHGSDVSGAEFIICDRLTVNAVGGAKKHVRDHATGAYVEVGPYPSGGTYRILERGALGTAAQAWPPVGASANTVHIFDFTIPIYMARRRIKRFSNGAPVINVTTLIDKYALQLGDLVALSTTRYVNFGYDGLDGNTKWQVIGKEVDRYANPPVIKWRLMWATHDTVPSITEVHQPVVPSFTGNPPDAATLLAMLNDEAAVRKRVLSGLVVSAGTGLEAEVSPGVAASETARVELESTVTLELEASATSWVVLDLSTGALTLHVDASAPDLLANQLLLAEVVTDGSSVTDVNNESNTRVLRSDAVDELAIKSLAVTSGKLGANSVIAGKLADGAVDTAGRLASSVVTTPKVAQQALGQYHFTGPTEMKTSLIPNGHFGSWSRG